MITRLEYLATADVLLHRKVVGLRAHLQLFFLRLFFMTDGAGRFRADAAVIRASLYAHELQQVSERDVVSRLQDLHRAGLIKLYTEKDVGYGKVADDFWQQSDKKRKVRHPDAPGEQPDLLPLVDSPVVEKKIRSGGGGRKNIPSPSIQFSSDPAPASIAPTGPTAENDSEWIARLVAEWPGIDVAAQLAKAHRKRRGDVERGWFERVWLPGVTPAAPHPSSVLRPPSSVQSEPPDWRATLDTLRPGHTYEGTFAGLPDDLRAEIQNHGRAA
jgi:hypothetical protein